MQQPYEQLLTDEMNLDAELRRRIKYTTEQVLLLEEVFKHDPTPSSEKREAIARQIGRTPRSIQIWFQNKRAKEKSRAQSHAHLQAQARERLARERGELLATTPQTPTGAVGGASSILSSPASVPSATLSSAAVETTLDSPPPLSMVSQPPSDKPPSPATCSPAHPPLPASAPPQTLTQTTTSTVSNALVPTTSAAPSMTLTSPSPNSLYRPGVAPTMFSPSSAPSMTTTTMVNGQPVAIKTVHVPVPIPVPVASNFDFSGFPGFPNGMIPPQFLPFMPMFAAAAQHQQNSAHQISYGNPYSSAMGGYHGGYQASVTPAFPATSSHSVSQPPLKRERIDPSPISAFGTPKPIFPYPTSTPQQCTPTNQLDYHYSQNPAGNPATTTTNHLAPIQHMSSFQSTLLPPPSHYGQTAPSPSTHATTSPLYHRQTQPPSYSTTPSDAHFLTLNDGATANHYAAPAFFPPSSYPSDSSHQTYAQPNTTTDLLPVLTTVEQNVGRVQSSQPQPTMTTTTLPETRSGSSLTLNLNDFSARRDSHDSQVSGFVRTPSLSGSSAANTPIAVARKRLISELLNPSTSPIDIVELCTPSVPSQRSSISISNQRFGTDQSTPSKPGGFSFESFDSPPYFVSSSSSSQSTAQ